MANTNELVLSMLCKELPEIADPAHDLNRWWASEGSSNEDLADFLIRQGILHPDSRQTLKMAQRGFLEVTSDMLLLAKSRDAVVEKLRRMHDIDIPTLRAAEITRESRPTPSAVSPHGSVVGDVPADRELERLDETAETDIGGHSDPQNRPDPARGPRTGPSRLSEHAQLEAVDYRGQYRRYGRVHVSEAGTEFGLRGLPLRHLLARRTFYHMITDQMPFTGRTWMEVICKHAASPLVPPHEVVPGLSPVLYRLISRMMAKNPQDRHPTFVELIADLDQLEAVLSRKPEAEVAPKAAAVAGRSLIGRLFGR